MTEAIMMTKRRRRGVGAVTMLLGALVAIGSLFLAVTAASANYPEYQATVTCEGSWTASANYVGGDPNRLVVMSVTINGQTVTGNGFTGYNPGTHGVAEPPISGVLASLRSGPEGFNIFTLSGTGFNTNWSGFIQVYRPIGDVWFPSHSIAITPPTKPANCDESTATPTNTVPVNTATPTNTPETPTATATSTLTINTATPTKTTTTNTATPTKTTPPCVYPGTATPTGGSQCTPTPTVTVPANTATPTWTTPPCVYPGTPVPSGGSQCTPTPPPATATNTPPMTGCYNGTGNPPTGTVVCTPTPVDSVAGVRTGGPGVPSAGTGFSDMSSTNMVFALLGLLAVTAGAAFMALGRTSDED